MNPLDKVEFLLPFWRENTAPTKRSEVLVARLISIQYN